MRSAVAGVWMFLALLSVGCGYRAGSLYPEEVGSVAVPIFENDTFYTGLERSVTDALIKEIHARTPYFVTGEAGADTVLTGRIVEVQKRLVSVGRGTGLAQEILFEVTVEFEWKDLRTGRILVERERFTGGDVYIPRHPVGEPVELGAYAVADELAQDIVDTMRAAW